jgi:hypothetical protein
MPRYFFDLRDGDVLISDDQGLVLATIEAAQDEAKRALASMAKDAIWTIKGNPARRHLAMVKIVTDQAIARSVGVDRAPGDGAAIEGSRAIGRKLTKSEILETEMGRQLDPVCNARQGRQVTGATGAEG